MYSIVVNMVNYHLGSLTKTCKIIIKNDSDYFFLVEDYVKIEKIMKMPSYIQEDFYKYNSKYLTLEQVENYIKEIKESLERTKVTNQQSFHSFHREELLENFTKLTQIKRDFIFKNLLD